MAVNVDPRQAPRGPTRARPVLVPRQERRALHLHLFTYVVGNALFWALWGALFVTADPWYWWPIVPLTGWTAVLLLHIWLVLREER